MYLFVSTYINSISDDSFRCITNDTATGMSVDCAYNTHDNRPTSIS